MPLRPVLGADTEVVLDGEIFGKPRDAAHARADARAAVRPHARRPDRRRAQRWQTTSMFALSHVARHVPPSDAPTRSRATSRPAKPLDKAGAYAIQGRAGAFVTRLDGSYSGVMGLPLFETAELLAKAGIPVL